MTNTERIKELAKVLFEKYNLKDWYFFVAPLSKKTLGECQYITKYIIVNSLYVEEQDFSDIEDTLRHEIAHAIAGIGTGHGAKWKAIARSIGATPKAKSKLNVESAKKQFNYQLAVRHDDGRIELRNHFQLRRSDISKKRLKGRPETFGKLIWIKL